jgi:hypothetical protein
MVTSLTDAQMRTNVRATRLRSVPHNRATVQLDGTYSASPMMSGDTRVFNCCFTSNN